ncbi:unnamed protein product [Periconia digitata]|uniref:Gag1-like clamp domain-containing protein n=1 Tax=Periconia digitata TaxID=1303443 RepID=A0A9W4UQN3_9PLEO|nr:unnamed protein product [Periconia digitata]
MPMLGRHSSSSAMENNHSATRAARRFLEDRVRTDWDWPTPPPCFSASDEEVRGVEVFRERYYADSTPSSGPSDNEDDPENPYKFDSPDSIAGLVERKAERKKRKRDEQLRNEMDENEGLRIFVARRDRWTGADAVRKYGTAARPIQDESSNPSEKTTVIPDSSTGESAGRDNDDTHMSSPGSSPTSTTTPPMDPSDSRALTTGASIPHTTLIPVAPPLLPTNSIRASITSRTYPDIYSKIVLQGRTPAVPINLADMTKALVKGWRDSGEWPPKQGALDPLPGSKKRALGGLGLGFSLGGGGGGRGDADRAHNAHKAGGAEGDAFLAHHPHLQKGVGGLRRMLHLSGHSGPMAAAAASPSSSAAAPTTPATSAEQNVNDRRPMKDGGTPSTTAG